jgi:hypothetical protein
MDFNLDGDFDKLSSFKVDMSDLDFLSSPRNTAKPKEPKERCEEESSSGNPQQKQDRFNFSFDFNASVDISFKTYLDLFILFYICFFRVAYLAHFCFGLGWIVSVLSRA